MAIAIADSHNVEEGCAAWPSIRLIAIKANLSRRQVQYHIIHLVQLGELKRQYRFWPGGLDNQTSLFTFVKMTDEDLALGRKAPGDKPGNEPPSLPIPLPKEARAWDKKKVARWQLQKEIEQVKARLAEHQDNLAKLNRYAGPEKDRRAAETQAAILALRSDLKDLEHRFDQKLY